MKSALRKNAFVSITKTGSRFLSIFGIIAIGVGFFAGVKNAAPDMKLSANSYFESENLAHFRLVSTLGFSEEDVDVLRGTDGISVYPGCFYDALAVTGDGNETVRIMSLESAGENNTVNMLTLTEGRFPENENECVVDSGGLISKRTVGETLTLIDSGSSPVSDTLKYTEYTIVGLFSSPMYIDKSSRGSTTVGNGTISSVVYIPKSDFTSEVYTEVYITASSLYEFDAYSDRFNALSDEIKAQLEDIGADRARARYDEILSDAEQKISDAETELADKKADAERQFAEAEQELADALQKITDGEAELKQAELDLEAAKQALKDSRAELDSGWDELERARPDYYEQITKAELEISENEQLLSDSRKKYESGLAEYENQLATYEDGVSQCKDARAQIDSNKLALSLIMAYYQETDPITKAQLLAMYTAAADGAEMPSLQMASAMGEQIASAEKQLASTENELSEAKIKLDAAKAELDEARTQLVVGETELTKGKTELEKARTDGLAKLEEAEQKLNDGEAAYLDGTEQYRRGELDYAQAVVDLEKGKDEYSDGREQYETEKADAEQKIRDAELEIRDAKRELNDLSDPKWYVFDRDGNVGYTEYGNNADRINNIAKVFPIFFVLVAALVCLTTMTRMVEEERVQIGTLKALGYNNRQIVFKYMLYAVSAAVAGAVFGIIVGQKLFPVAIISAYAMLYSIPETLTPIDWLLGGAAIIVCVVATALTVYVSCKTEFHERPAQLMRPKAPRLGKKVFLEKTPLWKLFSFNSKVTARNIFRYKRRMLMTVIGVAGCTALTLTGFALRDSISDIVAKQFGELNTYDGIVAYESSDEEEIGEVEQLLAENGESTRYYQKMFTTMSDVKTVKAYVVVPDSVDDFYKYYTFRDRVTHERYYIEDGGVIIDEKLSLLLDVQPGDTITLYETETEQKQVTVRAIMENYPSHYVYMTENDYRELFGKAPQYNMIAFLHEGLNEDESETLANSLMSFGCVLGVNFNEDVSNTFSTMLEALDMIIVVIVLSAGALAFVVLYNLTNININERIREVATLKVLGFYDKEVDSYIFRENVVLTLMGIAVGLFGGTFLAQFVIQTAEIDLVMFGREIAPLSYLWAGLVTLGFSVIVSLYMHRSLTRINMIDALKSVE